MDYRKTEEVERSETSSSMLADREGEPVALTFMKEGFQTFVLRYSVGDACRYPDILEEVSLAVWEVRSHAAAGFH